MKNLLLPAIMLTAFFSSFAQSGNPKYNKALADSLGGDDYGMKMYVLVILKTGSANFEKPKTDSLFGGHLAIQMERRFLRLS